ncbi:putative purple acid phosphatase precursor [Cryptosporidium canis]|uniref:acid phosphatase n=1 Tax=Cryptosporidium canis TaxID=195482 RepID=A0ABQ8P952_9CRYT|nr:putative purple acid phosphatase precursor [Cryptosporidium canis]KAJ1612886.1 putative purple acid phosphatase precursor [Cryptosporidium canis]
MAIMLRYFSLLGALILGVLKCSSSELTVFSIGDWGERTECLANVTSHMSRLEATLNPEFIVSVGDNFYQRGVKSVDDPNWEEVLEGPFGKLSRGLKVHSCLGDHDWRGSTTAQIDRTNSSSNTRWYLPGYWWYEKVTFTSETSLPSLFEKSGLGEIPIKESFHFNSTRTGNSTNCEIDCLEEMVDNLNTIVNRNSSWNGELSYKALISEYNSDRKTNSTAIFIYIDSWTLTQDPFKKTSISHRRSQLEFIEQTLKAAVFEKVDWIILVTHYPIYSSGLHGPHARIASILLPLIKKYKVDFMISGHDHHTELLIPEDFNTYFQVVGASSKPRVGFGATHENSIFKSNSCSFSSFTFSKDIAVSRIFSSTSPIYSYFKRSNRFERSKIKVESTQYPYFSSSLRVKPLVNVSGWTLSLTLFS